MRYNAHNDEIHENLERMRRDREAYEESLAVVRQQRPILGQNHAIFFATTAR